MLAVAVCLATACAGGVAAQPRAGEAGESPVVTAERTLAAEPTVTVLTCIESGDVVVRGWDRKEVRARSNDAQRIELRRADATADPNPATRIEVLVTKEEDEPSAPGGCGNSGNLELDVPRGASVQIKGNTGDVNVTDVSAVRVKTLSGDIELQRIAKVVEAWSANGTITLGSSKGRARLETISGEIEANGVESSESGDDLVIKTVSGEISLAGVGHTHVEAMSTNSSIDFNGALAHGGMYTFKTHSGAVTLTLPPDSSFQLNAKVYESGEITTDFPIRQVAVPKGDDPHGQKMGGGLLNDGRLTGVAGKSDKGDATLILAAFSGTLRLQKSGQ
ncbi:MAG TPA: DUF4097 family beta strand repeat-containing protein [Pyrinomonadaceae bacterium]|nr:DUF4097 family beta strand repeat-containing protein [Pyrinomonadaceae bacterium]